MTDRIEPVFTSEEWAAAEVEGEATVDGHTVYTEIDCLTILNPDPADVEIRTPELPKLIALANAVLKDDDKRKITRAWIETLAIAAHTITPYAMLKDSRRAFPASLRATESLIRSEQRPDNFVR